MKLSQLISRLTPKEEKIQAFRAYLTKELTGGRCSELTINFREYTSQDEWGTYLVSLSELATILIGQLSRSDNKLEHIRLQLGNYDISAEQARNFVAKLQDSLGNQVANLVDAVYPQLPETAQRTETLAVINHVLKEKSPFAGSFENQVGNLVNTIFVQSSNSDQKQEALSAINVLGSVYIYFNQCKVAA